MHAKIHLERTRGQREIVFDNVSIEPNDKEAIEFVLSNAEGDKVRLKVSRASLKELVSWKMIFSL